MDGFGIVGAVIGKEKDVDALPFSKQEKDVIKDFLKHNPFFFENPNVEAFVFSKSKKVVVISSLTNLPFDRLYKVVEAYSHLVKFMRDKYTSFSVIVDNLTQSENEIQLIIEVSLMSMYEYTKYLSHKKGEKQISFSYIHKERRDIEKRASIFAKYNIEARDLINESPSNKSPQKLAEAIKELFKGTKVEVEVWDEARIKKERMNLVLAVARGSKNPPRVVVLKYMPNKDESPIVFVGKGVIFDAGGYNIKTKSMEKMKSDMSGAVGMAYALRGIVELGVKKNIVAILPFVENLVSATAYLPGDIIVSRSGLSVEIKNTDAEGRLILADSLSLATDFKPRMIIDMATLTGACMVALGLDIAGLFGSADSGLVSTMLEAGKEKMEELWHMPLGEEYYFQNMQGKVSDLLNVAPIPYGGAIHAAIFLKQFVGNNQWLHLDIAGPAYTENEKLYKSVGSTGFGVRLLMEFVSKV